MIQFIQIFR